ncbi:acyltransferase [Muribaculaceae bacterium Isolate-110 (HZI)]|nr:acyltransferase [Muribaculaceae bacterium Isolate-110 (HZI)]
MKKRLEYIDRLKGLAMIMVVAGHIIAFCGIGYNNIYMDNIVLINMPLFLFLNGLVVNKPSMANGLWYIRKKICQILIPFLAWGLVITLYKGENYINFLFHFWKFGYWYLIVLFEFYLIYIPISLFSQKVGKSAKSSNVIFVGSIIVGYLVVRAVSRFLPDLAMSFTSYFQILEYYPFFFTGVLIKNYDVEKVLISHRNVVMTILLLGISGFYYLWMEDIYLPISEFILRIAGIMMLYVCFMLWDNNPRHDISLYIDRVLKRIGMHTLSIYMIQYFFFRMIDLKTFMQILDIGGNSLLLIGLCVFMSVLVCYLCILVEKVISTSDVLSVIFLGKNNYKYA